MLDREADKSREEKTTESTDREVRERPIRCAACRHVVTQAHLATTRDGKHEHVFTNPHGIVFHIACYTRAPGASARGAPSDEWSWFAGFVWRIAACGGCGAHIGWSFEQASAFFWGLITSKLAAD